LNAIYKVLASLISSKNVFVKSIVKTEVKSLKKEK